MIPAYVMIWARTEVLIQEEDGDTQGNLSQFEESDSQ